jgi:hypothetical protein
MKMHNLVSLPQLPAKHTKGKEPLVDYTQFSIFRYLKEKNNGKGICKGN